MNQIELVVKKQPVCRKSDGKRVRGKAGYTTKESKKAFRDLTAITAPHRVGSHTVEFLTEQWREILGIEINWKWMEYGEFLGTIDSEGHQLVVHGWSADFPDPDNFLRSAGWRRRTGWENEDFNRLIGNAQCMMDQEKRMLDQQKYNQE